MEQFRQVGEVLGSMKALMVLRDDIPINKRQCSLILEIFTSAFTHIAAEIRQNLRLEEKSTKWRSLDQPLRELYRVFREAELYLRHCLDTKDWWAKVVTLHQNKDCLEFHIHNLLCNFSAVIEAIEIAGEISGLDPDEIQMKGVLLKRKYDNEWNDPKLFELRYGEKYLVSKEMCRHVESAWREDRWLLVESLKEKKKAEAAVWTKNEQRLCDSLLKKLNSSEPSGWILFPSSILTGAKDYQVRRRLDCGTQLKEIQWLGESFVMRHVIGEIELLKEEISTLLSLSHPNILQHLCGFGDEEKKECFLVMEMMNKDLNCHIKENSSPRRRTLMSIPVIVDIMLQIARGLEYLHSQKIYHGNLNPTNILLKSRSSLEGYFHVKVSGFGLSSIKKQTSRSSPTPESVNPFIWHAPEVLAEQEEQGNETPLKSKFSEKADVYSFGMICFEILTGKVPFEDGHLQGDKMSRNIRAGERPLFPFSSPKFLVNLTRKCWQTDPALRPSFSSICRILRYIKKFLVMNPEAAQPELQMPTPDFYEIESAFQKKFAAYGSLDLTPICQIPFQMFSFRLAEIDKTRTSYIKDEIFKSAIDGTSTCRDENLSAEDLVQPSPATTDIKSVYSDVLENKFSATRKGATDTRSVSSEEKRTLAKKGASDTRSVCSEFPERKILVNKGTTDTRSVCSDAPERRTLPAKKGATDTKSTSSGSPDKKILTDKKSGGKDSNKKGRAVEDLLELGTDLICTEIPEKKPLATLRKSSSVRTTRKASPKAQDQRSPSPFNSRLQSMGISTTRSGLTAAMNSVDLSSRRSQGHVSD